MKHNVRLSWVVWFFVIGLTGVVVLLSSCGSPVGSGSTDEGDGGNGGNDDQDTVQIEDGGSLSGTIDSDRTLESNTRYTVNDSLSVEAELTIDSGAILEFAEDTQLLVRDSGVIRAIGTAARPIIFRGATENAGFWRGVLIYSNNSQNRLEHVNISHTGSNEIGGQRGALVLDGFRTGALAVVNVTITNGTGHGLVVENNATLLEFATNTFGNLSDTPVRITPNQIAQLDSLSTFESSNSDNRVEIDEFGSVDADATWPDPSIAYFVPDLLTVDSALTIEEGARLEFAASVRMEINRDGALIADASGGDPIVFTGTVETPGHWRGIQIESDDSRNIMDNVVVRYAGELGGFAGGENGNVYLYGGLEAAFLTLRNSTIADGLSHGVVYDSNTTLTDDGTNQTTPFASVTMSNIGDEVAGGYTDYHQP